MYSHLFATHCTKLNFIKNKPSENKFTVLVKGKTRIDNVSVTNTLISTSAHEW